ncbi:response regulator transcription factor [Metabacillus iocasae]|uniref:DNA-binding response OmpR family regulator n=1 Tax=Priestia iocasae TaxID=2291674 RepID=A0ABS2QSL5_9BACI|nr:response regulator transcription factor [Metabacillus iocasae]MBM7702380.1 DNA-binding response OmpR family regulator [Metabacillus iocasae]
MERILLVDDEMGLLEMMSMALRAEGFQSIDKAINAQEALAYVRKNQYAVILLDVTLPDMDGYVLCTKIREMTKTPIMFLTARTSDLDILTGLNVGGDDYITKPFKPLEVIARIRAKIRREQNYREAEKEEKLHYTYGFLTLNLASGQLYVEGIEVPCTARELQLLAFFFQHPNYIFSIQDLYERIWGTDSLGDTNTVMVYMNRLRKKIEQAPNNPKVLINVRGLGYKFVPPKGESV